MPVGAFLGGVVADLFGLRAPWVVGAVLMTLPLPWAARSLTAEAVEAARAEPGD
jgi:predicted MFS family arabinose efflux permease